jgi:hypothetical protein
VSERRIGRWKRYIGSFGKSRRSIEGGSGEKRRMRRKEEMKV